MHSCRAVRRGCCTAMPGQQTAVPSIMLSMSYRLALNQEQPPPQKHLVGH